MNTNTHNTLAPLTGFIAADGDNWVWGAGATRAACDADARDYRDGSIDGLTFYRATAAALADVAARGADASMSLEFDSFPHFECRHESESVGEFA